MRVEGLLLLCRLRTMPTGCLCWQTVTNIYAQFGGNRAKVITENHTCDRYSVYNADLLLTDSKFYSTTKTISTRLSLVMDIIINDYIINCPCLIYLKYLYSLSHY